METLRFIVPILFTIADIMLVMIGVVFPIYIFHKKFRQRNPDQGETGGHFSKAKKKIIIPVILLACYSILCYDFIVILLFIGNYAFDYVSQDQKRYPDPRYINSWYELKSYHFDPITIIPMLKRGENNLFQPGADFFADDVYNPGSFPWRQQDFLLVSNGFYEFATNHRLKDWQAHSWLFDRSCDGNSVGFDHARFSYLNPNKGENPTIGEFTLIDINLLNKTVSWGENRDFESDSFFGWQSVDPTQIKITADDALQIADEHGGKEIRQAFQNKECSIDVFLNTQTNRWEVEYFDTNFEVFEVIVDPKYGSYEIK